VKYNRLICPSCFHETFDESAYTTCDACGRGFNARESLRLHGPRLSFFPIGDANTTAPIAVPGCTDTNHLFISGKGCQCGKYSAAQQTAYSVPFTVKANDL
jgi:hypothetical protein